MKKEEKKKVLYGCYLGHTLEEDVSGGDGILHYTILDNSTVYDFAVFREFSGDIKTVSLASSLIQKYAWYRDSKIEFEDLVGVLNHSEDVNEYRHDFYFCTDLDKLIDVISANNREEFEDFTPKQCKEWFFKKFPDKFTPAEVIGELL